jgi:hypothetical protein
MTLPRCLTSAELPRRLLWLSGATVPSRPGTVPPRRGAVRSRRCHLLSIDKRNIDALSTAFPIHNKEKPYPLFRFGLSFGANFSYSCYPRHTFTRRTRPVFRASEGHYYPRRHCHEDLRLCAVGTLHACRYRSSRERLRSFERRRWPPIAAVTLCLRPEAEACLRVVSLTYPRD